MIAVYLLYMFDRNSGGKTFQTELLFDYYSIIFELYTQKSKLIHFWNLQVISFQMRHNFLRHKLRQNFVFIYLGKRVTFDPSGKLICIYLINLKKTSCIFDPFFYMVIQKVCSSEKTYKFVSFIVFLSSL